MQFVGRSTGVLRIINFHQLTAGSTATFDRGKTRASIVSFNMLAVTRTAFPLDDIAAIHVQKRERQSGNFAYSLKLRRRRGEDVALRCRTRADAVQCQRAITEFLASP